MSKQKQKNKEIRKRLFLEKEKENNPDLCFCDEPEYCESDFLDFTEPVDGFPYWDSVGYREPIYKCKKCGKKYIESRLY